MDTMQNLHWKDVGEYFPPEDTIVEVDQKLLSLINKVGIVDEDLIKYIVEHDRAEKYFIIEQEKRTRWKRYEDRFKVPQGLTKKQLTDLKKKVQESINFWKKRAGHADNDYTKITSQEEQARWIDKKKRIENTLKFHDSFGTKLNIEKATAYPIEQLLEFNHSGFAKCLWHEEKSGSLHHDRKRNKVHCFAGCGDYDSIDVYQKINNVSFNEAVRQLSK